MDGVLGWKAEDFTLVSAETVDYGPVDPAVEYFRKEVTPFSPQIIVFCPAWVSLVDIR